MSSRRRHNIAQSNLYAVAVKIAKESGSLKGQVTAFNTTDDPAFPPASGKLTKLIDQTHSADKICRPEFVILNSEQEVDALVHTTEGWSLRLTKCQHSVLQESVQQSYSLKVASVTYYAGDGHIVIRFSSIRPLE